MKKIFTLLTVACFGTIAFGQTVFQSNLSSWSAGDPTDWMTTARTSITSANVVEQTIGATYGTSTASLINTTTSHKRFATGAITVVSGGSYLIEMWVAAQNTGDLRTGWYDVTNGAYNPAYNAYIDVATATGGNVTKLSQTVTVPATCSSAEFILSVRSTDPTTAPSPFFVGIIVDSVAITATTPPVVTTKKIYDIQYPANANGDSPELGNVVTTSGTITGIVKNGPGRHSFFIQDSSLAYNGLYIYELNDSTLTIGDSVEVTGTVDEFNLGSAPQKLTELKSVTNIIVLGTGTSPTPVSVSTLNANMEEWEGVLVKVTNAQCTSTTVGFGKWSLNDVSGVINADDDIFPYALNATVGTNYDVTGIGHYFFDEYSILPRDINDISIATGLSEVAVNNLLVYPNPATDKLNFNLNSGNVTVNLFDVTGKILKTVNTKATKFSVNLTGFANGIYFYSIIDANGETVQTNRFVVAK